MRASVSSDNTDCNLCTGNIEVNEPPEITTALQDIERASTPPRQLAREAVRRHRQPSQPSLTQAMIDTGGDNEERRQRFISAALKFRRRGWLSWLLR